MEGGSDTCAGQDTLCGLRVWSRILLMSPSLSISISHYCMPVHCYHYRVCVLEQQVLFIGKTLTPAGEGDILSDIGVYKEKSTSYFYNNNKFSC